MAFHDTHTALTIIHLALELIKSRLFCYYKIHAFKNDKANVQALFSRDVAQANQILKQRRTRQ